MSVSGIIDTPVNLNSVNSPAATTSTDSVQAEQDKFMKLLVTQLKNQDPLNPMDNAAMTSQLAQLSTVTGINKVNATLESLRGDVANTQASTAISMIGKGVLVEGKGIVLSSTTDEDGKTTSSSVFGVELASDSQEVAIEIKNSSGKTVRTMAMTNAEAGTYPITWDGLMDDKATTAPAGNYTFTVTAKTAGNTLTSTPLQLAAVASVSTGAGGVKLNTSLGHFAMSEIKEVL